MTIAVSTFNIPGLKCAGCIAKVEGGMARIEGVTSARVNFTTRRVRIDHLDSIDADALRDALVRIGFPAEKFVGPREAVADGESRMLARARSVWPASRQ